MTENQLRYLTLQETKRHNEATEALTSSDLSERARANLAKETETNRSNLERERLEGERNAMQDRSVSVSEDYNAHKKRVETAETVFKGVNSVNNVLDTILGFFKKKK